jgi:hypothetical protein
VTPKIGQVRAEPKVVAKIDLEALGAEIKATVERAKDNDPRELKTRISNLHKEIVKLESSAKIQKQVEKVVEVPVLDNATAALLRDCRDWLGEIRERTEGIAKTLSSIEGRVKPAANPTPPRPVVAFRAPVPRPKTETQPVEGEITVTPALRRLLTVLAQYPGGKETASLARIAGYTVNGHLNNMLGNLRSAGYVNRGQPITITDAGLSALGAFDPLPTGRELQQYWISKVGTSMAKLLNVLIAAYPNAMKSADVAEAAGYTVNGHFNNMMGSLRTMGLIEGYGQVKAVEEFFS